jgi:anti-anti-sigma factor
VEDDIPKEVTVAEVVNLYEPDFDTTEHNGVVTVEARAGLQLDLNNRDAFKDAVAEAAGSMACSALVIDLSQATFMDCSNLEVIQRANNTLRSQNKPLVLDIAGPRAGSIGRLLEVSGVIDHMVVVTGRESEAAPEVRQSGPFRVHSNPNPTPLLAAQSDEVTPRPRLRLVHDAGESSSD